MAKRLGKHSVAFSARPRIIGYAGIAGKKEGAGPLREQFDYISEDAYFGEKTWEKAESRMIKQCFSIVCDKAKLPPSELDYVFSGDLLNQCVSSAFAMRDSSLPYFGLYGACSTMAEALSLGALSIDSGAARTICAITGSHFCSAEKQYRFPLEYGGQRCPTTQWTVTGAGAVILSKSGRGPVISIMTTGEIVDAGINDANNMGAAMAPAAYETIKAHMEETGRDFDYYDAIFTGDLGAVGHDLLCELFKRDGVELGPRYMDCGVLIYDKRTQDVHCGGSGCGCSASVLGAHILKSMENGVWNRVLFAATGALMSPLTVQQNESIPGICHAVAIENVKSEVE